MYPLQMSPCSARHAAIVASEWARHAPSYRAPRWALLWAAHRGRPATAYALHPGSMHGRLNIRTV